MSFSESPRIVVGRVTGVPYESPELGDPELSNFYLQSSYTLTGEMR